MKYLLLCAFVAVASAVTQENYQLSAERLSKVVEKTGKPCAKGGADPAQLVAKVADGSLPRDDVHNEFLYCFAKTGGYIQEDGHIVVDAIAGLIGADHPLYEQMRESLRKCNDITKENPVLTTVAMNDCIVQNAPVFFVFS